MFSLQRNRIGADQTRLDGIVFECSLHNRRPRNATLISQEYELWRSDDIHGAQARFLSRLSLALTSISTEPPTFTPQSSRGFKLIWHFTVRELQQIEDSRQGNEPHFEIRSRLFAHVQYRNADGTPNGEAHYVEESAYDSETNGYPIRFKIDHTTWAGILDDVRFRHIILHELSIPAFPPAFGRAENHLKEAWSHHRAGRADSALMSCFKAFECLGFSITSGQIPRADALAHLMSGQEEPKRKKIEALWESLTSFCHLGRHDRAAPIHLTHADGELAVVCTTMLLTYLAAP
jgi:hypothetical protein